MPALPLRAEAPLAFAASAVTFVLAAVVLHAVDSAVVAGLLCAVFLAALVVLARVAGSAYTVPVGIAGMVALDWFYLPPTHALEVPDTANTVDLLAYLVFGVLLGQLAAQAARRAEASERARALVADEQAALRRVATLVAHGASGPAVFTSVAAESGLLLGVDGVRVARYESGAELVHLAEWAKPGTPSPPPYERAGLDGVSVSAEVLRTGAVARIDQYRDVTARSDFNRMELASVVGAPILVEDHLWGLLVAWSGTAPLTPGTEDRLAAFAELVAIAIANAENRAALTASRARIVAASDTARRRIERDLHDGAQQRLVSAALRLRGSLRDDLPPGAEELGPQLDAVAGELDEAIASLRETAHGIHPAALAEGGLRPALRGLARRSAVPVNVDVQVTERLPEQVELAAYFVVAEALTNAAKHAGASLIDLEAAVSDGVLTLCIRDDGRGGALTSGGSGLLGLVDRAEALGGRLHVESPPGRGTTILVTLPTAPVEALPTAKDTG